MIAPFIALTGVALCLAPLINAVAARLARRHLRRPEEVAAVLERARGDLPSPEPSVTGRSA